MKAQHALLSVDYITATAQSVSQLDAFDTIAQTEITTRLVQGYEVDGWKHYGYEGWRVGEVAFGNRYDGALIKAWGDRADDLWREIALYAHNVSRLDICVDVHFDTPQSHLAKNGYMMLDGSPTRRKYAIIYNSDAGETLYLGSRTSEKFGRIYDKGIETRTMQSGLWWRYELEIKGKLAHVATREILAKDYEEQIEVMADMVQSFFEDEGLPIPWPRGKGAIISRTPSNGLAGDEALDWLRRQVRPTVQRLVGMSRLEDVLHSLGIDEFVSPN